MVGLKVTEEERETEWKGWIQKIETILTKIYAGKPLVLDDRH